MASLCIITWILHRKKVCVIAFSNNKKVMRLWRKGVSVVEMCDNL